MRLVDSDWISDLCEAFLLPGQRRHNRRMQYGHLACQRKTPMELPTVHGETD